MNLCKLHFLAILPTTVALIAAIDFWMPPPVFASYSGSAHGNSTTGVSGKAAGYTTGHCAHCHNLHDSRAGVTSTPKPYTLFAEEENVCYDCHDGNPVPLNIQTEFSDTYIHGKHGAVGTDYMTTYNGRHNATESSSSAFAAGNRHAECTDCHNPHQASAINVSDSTKGPLIGSTGVNPTNNSAGLVPGFYTFVTISNADHEYKVCFKCHSDWAGFGTGTNQALEFNPANDSYHWVENDQGLAPGIYGTATFNTTYVGKMMPRYNGATDASLRSAKMRCSDCHGPNNAGGAGVPAGVHGSSLNNVLKVPTGSTYATWNATIKCSTASIPASCEQLVWCFNCHSPNFSGTGFYGGSKNLHLDPHASKSACQQCHLANPHGATGSGTTAQRRHLLSPSTFSNAVDSLTPHNYSQGSGHATVLIGCT